jgi:hypothetical protein
MNSRIGIDGKRRSGHKYGDRSRRVLTLAEKSKPGWNVTALERLRLIKQAALISCIFSAAKTNTLGILLKKKQEHVLTAEMVNTRDKSGCTPLYYACERNYPEIARALLQLGADVNSTNIGGNTALHAAFNSNNPKVRYY